MFGEELPRVVAPLTYAGATAQSHSDVFDYKKDPTEAQSAAANRRLSILVKFYVELHSGCIRRYTSVPITSVVTVPSGKGRVPHPLDNFLRYFPTQLRKTRTRYIGAVRTGRAVSGIRPDDFDFELDPVGDHLLVLEDSWVQGNNALSVAVQARRKGAAEVSVVPIARYLDVRHNVTATWLETNAATEPFNPLICPVTTGTCPPPTQSELEDMRWSNL